MTIQSTCQSLGVPGKIQARVIFISHPLDSCVMGISCVPGSERDPGNQTKKADFLSLQLSESRGEEFSTSNSHHYDICFKKVWGGCYGHQRRCAPCQPGLQSPLEHDSQDFPDKRETVLWQQMVTHITIFSEDLERSKCPLVTEASSASGKEFQ